MLEISTQLTPGDYVAFAQWFYRNAPAGKAFMRRLYLFGLGLFILFAFLERDRPGYGIDQPLRYAFYLFVSFLVLGALYRLFLAWLLPAAARMHITSGSKRALLAPIRYTFTPDTIRVETEGRRGTLRWSEVRNIAETEAQVYLLLGGMNAMILSKNALPAAGAAQLAHRLKTMLNEAHSMKSQEISP